MKRNKKKGFTLIELLAVIVILAIIALIATPIILNVIDTAKIGAAENSALGYIDAVEKQVMISQLDSNETNKILPGVYDKAELAAKKVQIKGGSDITALKVRVNSKGEVEAGKFCINGKSIDYDGKAKYNKEVDYCNGEIELEGGSTPQVAYYAFGEPTTSSTRTTDYTTLGKNVFVKLEGEQKSVCIVRNGEPSPICFKNNNYAEEQNHIKEVFEVCYAPPSDEVYCGASGFYCNVSSDGNVYCRDGGADESCNVDSDDLVICD